MTRPALSASRATRILDLLASVPDRHFTLTDIVRATGVNAASCLAILGELSHRGYVCRHTSRKTYWLGPALIAAGNAAAVANPMLGRAEIVAERLCLNLRRPVLLSTRVDDEIVCVFSLPGEDGRTAGLRPGERVPLVPPVGASFIAWASPNEAEDWIARRADAKPSHVDQWLRDTLALTKERGFHVTLRRPETEDIASMLSRAASGDRTSDFYRQIAAYVEALDVGAAQPDVLDSEATYDTLLIASPIIDVETSAIYNLCLGGFSDPLTGPAIAELGHQLTLACLEVMKR